MIDLNTLFAEFLNKAIAAVVAEQVKTLTEQNEELILRVTELERLTSELDDKVDECDVERAVERHFENFNINEAIDMDGITEYVLDSRGFADGVRESLIDSLQGRSRY